MLQVKGVKGPSWLSCLNSLDFIKGMSPDYMHSTLLGVSKLLLKLWTTTSICRSTLHDIHGSADMRIINNRIDKILIPSEIRRKPRGMADVKHWKGELINHYKI